MIFKKLVIGLAAGLAITFCAAAVQAAESPAATPIYAEKGEQTCLKCHDGNEKVMAIMSTPHAVKGDSRTPAANHACESCHGASPEHIASRPA